MRPARWKALSIAVVVSPLLLAACTAAQELRQVDSEQCTSYGFKSGTTAFSRCLQNENLARRYGWWDGWPQPQTW